MDLTKLVDAIEKLYKNDPKRARVQLKHLLYNELDLRIKEEKLQLLKELSDGLRLLLRYHKNEIYKTTNRQ